MKTYTTADRLRTIMDERNMKQVDILEKAQPLCKRFCVKLGKTDLSQYVSGKVEPGQEKLSILSMVLDVSEAWLMGYDVPRERMIQKPIGISTDGLSEMATIFDQLSADNQAKLLELGRLFLTSQRSSGES